MTSTNEIGHSRSLVADAEARLAYQVDTVRRLGLDSDPRFAAIAKETLALMESWVARLRANLASLLKERGRRAPGAERLQTAATPDIRRGAGTSLSA